MWELWACASQTSSMETELDQGPQLLCFEIHCLVCAKAIPRQWLKMGWGKLHKADPFQGDIVLYCHPILAQTPQWLCCIFLRLNYLSLSPSLGILYTLWSDGCPTFNFLYFLPISFYTVMNPNKIFVPLVLSLYLLLRGPNTRWYQVSFMSYEMI